MAWTQKALLKESRVARRRMSTAMQPQSLREGQRSRLSKRGKRHCKAPGLRRKRSRSRRRAWRTPTTRAGSEHRARALRRHRSAREKLWRHCQTLPRKGMPLPQLPPPQSLQGRAPTSQKKVQRKSPVCQVRARRRPQARRKPTLFRACSASRRRRAPGTRETAPWGKRKRQTWTTSSTAWRRPRVEKRPSSGSFEIKLAQLWRAGKWNWTSTGFIVLRT